MSNEIVLYDLPSPQPCRSWSANAWKTRLVLNFKGVPYKTEWINYIHLQQTLKDFGLKPNPPGSWSDYSVPTIRLPDGSYLMDSAVIADKLEALYPAPSLRLNSELEAEARGAIGSVFMALMLYVVPIGVHSLVAPEDLEWFISDRASRFKMTEEELLTPKDADAAFAAAEPGFQQLRRVLTQHKTDAGPFVLGSVPSYADFSIISTVMMFKQASAEFFAVFLSKAGVEVRKLYEACEEWTKKQD